MNKLFTVVKWVKLIKTFLEYLTFHLYNCFLVPLSLYSGLWERIVLFSTPCNHQNKRAMAPWTEIIHLNKSNKMIPIKLLDSRCIYTLYTIISLFQLLKTTINLFITELKSKSCDVHNNIEENNCQSTQSLSDPPASVETSMITLFYTITQTHYFLPKLWWYIEK